jgi:23S rRNA (pseudouridine1915-N3)-methyltransferase
MRIVVAAVGRLKSGPEQDLVVRYAQRIQKSGKPIGMTALDTIEIPESRASTAEQRKDEEAQTLLSKLNDKTHIFAFDERGKNGSSPEFARQIETVLDAGIGDIAFVIGGPDGLAQSLRDKANQIVSFGKLTMPHQLVRVLVLEQIYRATTILTNHPYHRE